MKRFRAALKNKSNWPSLVTLVLILACSLFSFWDTRFSERARSAAFALVAVEFFIMLVVHLEEIKGAVREIKNDRGEGTHFKKWTSGETTKLIVEAKEELFFCGHDLARLFPHRGSLLETSDKIHIRLLVMDMDDESVRKQFMDTFGRLPSLQTLEHLGWFLSKKNIDIRTVKITLAANISAKDMKATTGKIQICHVGYNKYGYQSPYAELTPADTEWYDFYKEQIELLWAQGTPWPPKGAPHD